MAEEIKQRITIEADEAIARLKALTGLEFELAKGVEKASDAGKEKVGVIDRLTGGIRQWGAALLGVASPLAAVIFAMRQMAAEGREALSVIVNLGKATRNLAGNVGGRVADQTVAEINKVALGMSFTKEGRNQLVAAAGRFTDLSPKAGADDIRRFVHAAATLQRGVPEAGGAVGADLLVTMGKSLNMSPERAADLAALAVSSGYDPASLQQTVQRFGPMGGTELISLLVAAKGEGLVGDSQRQAMGFLANLDQRDERGRLARPLRAAGITDKMSMPARMEALFAARRSGALSEGQFMAAIGGVQNLQFVAPLESALKSKDYLHLSTQAQTGWGHWAEGLARRATDSKWVAQEEAAGRAELRGALATEADTGAARGEIVKQEIEAEMRSRGAGPLRRFFTGIEYDVSRLTGRSPEDAARDVDVFLMGSRYEGAGRRGADAVVNIQTQINTGVNPHTDVRPPEVP
jgi:hypothetical protein